jgi:hypothetical protein
MEALIPTLLSVITDILPIIGTVATGSTSIEKVVTLLEQVVPVAVTEFSTLLAPIQNIIAALSSNSTTTATQLAALQALDAQLDAAFEAAANALPQTTP